MSGTLEKPCPATDDMLSGISSNAECPPTSPFGSGDTCTTHAAPGASVVFEHWSLTMVNAVVLVLMVCTCSGTLDGLRIVTGRPTADALYTVPHRIAIGVTSCAGSATAVFSIAETVTSRVEPEHRRVKCVARRVG